MTKKNQPSVYASASKMTATALVNRHVRKIYPDMAQALSEGGVPAAMAVVEEATPEYVRLAKMGAPK